MRGRIKDFSSDLRIEDESRKEGVDRPNGVKIS
jgi:hypothetical protein